jgi:hypothetical protein
VSAKLCNSEIIHKSEVGGVGYIHQYPGGHSPPKKPSVACLDERCRCYHGLDGQQLRPYNPLEPMSPSYILVLADA